MKKVFFLLTLLAVTILVSGCLHQAQPAATNQPITPGPDTQAGTPAPGTIPGTVPEMLEPGESDITEEPEEPIMGSLGDVTESESEGRSESIGPGQVREFNMTARQWSFSPSTITVDQGDIVTLRITSVDVKHGFSLSAFGVNVNLNPGQETVVEFVADKKGTFSFRCSVVTCGSGHSGMTGELIVE